MSIRERKLKDGTKVFDAVLEYGKKPDGTRDRQVKTFGTRKEAEAEEKRAAIIRRALKSRTGRITLGFYVERYYWPITSRRLEATSLDTYRTELDKRILPNLGDVNLDDIDRLKIQAMLDTCNTESVARKALGLLKTILNEAVGDGFMASNPALARYALPKKGRKRDNGLILSDFDEIGQFVATVQNDAPEAITRLVMSGLLLGLRPEERYALNHEDFDFANGTVTINGAYVMASKTHGGNQMKSPKTELSQRTIPMPQAFIDWFYWDASGEGAWIVGKSGRLSPSTGRKMWNRYLDAHPDLPRVTLENMRHSFATSCLQAGMNVEDLSRILGHSDINTTFRRYVKPDLKNMRRSVAVIPYPD